MIVLMVVSYGLHDRLATRFRMYVVGSVLNTFYWTRVRANNLFARKNRKKYRVLIRTQIMQAQSRFLTEIDMNCILDRDRSIQIGTAQLCLVSFPQIGLSNKRDTQGRPTVIGFSPGISTLPVTFKASD